MADKHGDQYDVSEHVEAQLQSVHRRCRSALLFAGRSLRRHASALDGSLNSVIAGNGTPGSSLTQLYGPMGIFVTTNYSLYVADYLNNRIQMFPSGQLTATTVAGDTAPGTITLFGPSGVALDADGYMFIVDRFMNRVVGQSTSGFRCIVGCTYVNGSAPNQLSVPSSLSFDSYGNIFVSDTGNRRIQKFLSATNSCGMYRKETFFIPCMR